MFTVFTQVLKLLIYSAIGYALCKTRILDQSHSSILSKLLVWIFLPCNNIITFAKNCNIDYIKSNYKLLTVSIPIVIILGFLMHFVSKLLTKDDYKRKVLEYSLVTPNSGYMGYPMAESIYGEQGLTNVMVFCLPLSVYIYTYGFSSLTKMPLSLKKMLNPVLISMLLGIIWGLTAIPIPDYVNGILTSLSGCMAPVSMILAGVVISEFKIKTLLTDPSTYITSLLRLIVIPVSVGFILVLFNMPKEILTATVLILSMPCGLNTIVFPKSVNEDCKSGAGIAFISSIFSCITIPIVLSIFNLT